MSAAVRDLIVAIALVGAAALLAACGGGGDDEPCAFELVTLADGRVVPAPNTCPPAVQP